MINRAALNPTAASAIPRISRPLCLLGAALLLLVLQLLSGTGPIYALLVFALLVASYTAVCWAGGLETLFGIAIFYLLLQHVLISQIAKIFFWEPADATLRQPIPTMGVYVVGMASLALGVRLANRIRRRRPLFVAETRPNRLLWTSIICTIFSSVILLATRTIGVDTKTGGAIEGGVLGPLKQISFLGPLAIASGTAYIIKSSGGRRSFGLLNATPIFVQIAIALVGANRQASVSPVIIYILTCIAFRYRFRLKHYVLLLVSAYIANFIVFTYALVARNFVRTGNIEQNISRSLSIMMDIVQNPSGFNDRINNQEAKTSRTLRQFDYYKHSSPTLDRYTVVSWADAVVDATINHGETGWETIQPGFVAALPRFLYPDKSAVNAGNFLAHREAGLMPNRKDHTTGITLGFFADAFSSFGWLGISVIPCLVILCLMIVYQMLIDVRIWGNVLMLSLVVQLTWSFSEATVADMVTLCLVGSLAAGVGLSVLYVFVHALDKVTARIRHTVLSSIHPRQRALQRVLAAAPHAGKLMGIKQAGRLEELQ